MGGYSGGHRHSSPPQGASENIINPHLIIPSIVPTIKTVKHWHDSMNDDSEQILGGSWQQLEIKAMLSTSNNGAAVPGSARNRNILLRMR